MTLQTTTPVENSGSPSRTFACGKCGSPIIVYPPDDIHKLASRERSSFLEAVESIGVCSKCNETTHLYWGKPVVYRALVILTRQAAVAARQLLALTPLGRIGLMQTNSDAPGAEAAPELTDEEREEVENRLIDYISDNGGALVPGKAAEELQLPVELVKESIERMRLDGRLTPAGEGSSLGQEAPANA